MNKSIALGSDHAGYELKEAVREHLNKYAEAVENMGTDSPDSVDYPDFAHPVARSVESGKHDLAVLICGSANGVAMAANKHQGIRAAICWNAEIAKLSREHNNANILCLPARFLSVEEALEIIDAFFQSEFEGGRHARRVDKINC